MWGNSLVLLYFGSFQSWDHLNGGLFSSQNSRSYLATFVDFLWPRFRDIGEFLQGISKNIDRIV